MFTRDAVSRYHARMGRVLVLVYGAVVYAAFLAVFGALFLFGSQFGLVRAIDAGPSAPLGEALAIDIALIGLFGVTHSVLARAPIKRALMRVIPPAAERSTYVLVATATLALLIWQWRAVPDLVWHVDVPRPVFWAVSGAAGALIVYSTWLTNHFDLFGLRQVWLHSRGVAYTPVPFVEKSLYRYVRHPMMLGVLLWMWLVPTMSIGHFVFATGMTAYIVIGVVLEQRGLARELGATYVDYCRRVPAVLPLPRRS